MRNSIFTTILTLSLLAPFMACGGGGGSHTDPPVITAPTILTFTASATTVDYGTPVTLGWTLGGSAPTAVVLDSTALSNTALTTTVTPVARHTYTLTVTNTAGTASKTVSVVSKGVTQFSKTTTNAGGNLAKDPSGILYAQNHKLNTDGSITPFGNLATNGLHWSQHDNAFLAISGFTSPTNSLYRVDLSGNATVAISNFPYEYMTVAKDGTIYAAASGMSLGHILTVIHPNGATATITGDNQFFPAGEMILDATEAYLYIAGGISGTTTTTVNGIPAVTATYANVIYKINLITSQITTVAGQFNVPGHANGIGTAATFNTIGQTILSNDGTALYFCDIWNGLIRKMDLTTLNVTTVAGTLLPQPYALPLNAPLWVAGSYTAAQFIPMGIVQATNGDLVFSINSAYVKSNGSTYLDPVPVCIVTLP